jgi:predicted ribosome quality control (RQC) complex YloA/Tae2 family protein
MFSNLEAGLDELSEKAQRQLRNYFCIGGRDAKQNVQIVKKYFSLGDAYVHANLH